VGDFYKNNIRLEGVFIKTIYTKLSSKEYYINYDLNKYGVKMFLKNRENGWSIIAQ